MIINNMPMKGFGRGIKKRAPGQRLTNIQTRSSPPEDAGDNRPNDDSGQGPEKPGDSLAAAD